MKQENVQHFCFGKVVSGVAASHSLNAGPSRSGSAFSNKDPESDFVAQNTAFHAYLQKSVKSSLIIMEFELSRTVS